MNDPIVITSIARTPIGKFRGVFKDTPATTLGATVIQAAVERAHIQPESIDEVLMGCVLPAGLGQAPARQAAMIAGLPVSTPCTTLNKVCGSGMKAIMVAHDELLANSCKIAIAGGMENMSMASKEHMLLDGLTDPETACLMGDFAEDCAQRYHISRETQDQFATVSLQRAQSAHFDGEIVPVNRVFLDEHPGHLKLEAIPRLSPAFRENGTITAASSSSISDGAAAVSLMRLSQAKQLNISVLAIIRGHSSHAQNPREFPTAPIEAIRKLLNKIEWNIESVDLFEINEAFAVVPLLTMQALHIPHEKVNIHGGACALGHPLGASGARIVVTLAAALEKYGLKRGIASLCIGGGEATAIAIERGLGAEE